MQIQLTASQVLSRESVGEQHLELVKTLNLEVRLRLSSAIGVLFILWNNSKVFILILNDACGEPDSEFRVNYLPAVWKKATRNGLFSEMKLQHNLRGRILFLMLFIHAQSYFLALSLGLLLLAAPIFPIAQRHTLTIFYTTLRSSGSCHAAVFIHLHLRLHHRCFTDSPASSVSIFTGVVSLWAQRGHLHLTEGSLTAHTIVWCNKQPHSLQPAASPDWSRKQLVFNSQSGEMKKYLFLFTDSFSWKGKVILVVLITLPSSLFCLKPCQIHV